jgi:hypothetical protein
VTGPEHFTAAARLAADAQSVEAALHASQDDEQRAALDRQHARITARGQIHAALALAAATVDLDDGDIWAEVIR